MKTPHSALGRESMKRLRESTGQLECAVRELEKNTGLNITGYCVQEDYSESPGCYLCYIECGGHGSKEAGKNLICACAGQITVTRAAGILGRLGRPGWPV